MDRKESGFCDVANCKGRMVIKTSENIRYCFKHYHSTDILQDIDKALKPVKDIDLRKDIDGDE